MIKVYLTNTAALPDPLVSSALIDSLPQGRRESIVSALLPDVRRQRLGAGLLLGTVLAGYGTSWDELSLGKHGKPLSAKLKFNLSHSGDCVALAVAEQGEVGCDIEKLREIPEGVIGKLPIRERKWVDGFSEEKKTRAFFRLWTRRESYLKMTGEGLSGFSELEIISDEEVLQKGIRRQCFFHEYKMERYVLCVCADREQIWGKSTEIQIG